MPHKTMTALALVLPVLTFGTGPALAGLFGPSSYEECVRKLMRGSLDRNSAVSKAVAISCRNKFPDSAAGGGGGGGGGGGKTKGSKPIQKYSYGKQFRLDLQTASSYTKGHDAILKIDFVDFPPVFPNNNLFTQKKSPRFMNHNAFSVGGVIVGIRNEGESCSQSLRDYQYTVDCNGAISENSSQTTTCDDWQGTFCVVGFWTEESFRYKADVDQFVRRYLEE